MGLILEIAQKNAHRGHVKYLNSSSLAQEELSSTEGYDHTQNHTELICTHSKGEQKTAIINLKWQQLELTNKLIEIIIFFKKATSKCISCLKLCVIRAEAPAQKINSSILPREITKIIHPASQSMCRDEDNLQISSSYRESRAETGQAKLAPNSYVPMFYSLILSLYYGHGLSCSLWCQEERLFCGKLYSFLGTQLY